MLFVSQMSFLMSTFKYVCAVFLRLNDLKPEDAAVVGGIMVMLDVVFMLGSVVAVVLIVVLLRASATTLQEKKTPEVDSVVKVVPTSHEVEQTLKKQIAALKWQKNIRQTLAKNTQKANLGRVKSILTRKVEEIVKNHQNHRNMAVQNIKQQQVQRRSSLQLRVQIRNQKNASRATVQTEESATAEKVFIQKEAATTAAATSPTASVRETNIGTTKESKTDSMERLLKKNLTKKIER